MNKRHKIVSQTVRTIVVWTIALICAVPLYYVVISSFKTPIDMIKHPLQLPTQWLWNNYIDAFADGTIIQAFINTITVTAVAVILQVLIGSLAAYGVVQKNLFYYDYWVNPNDYICNTSTSDFIAFIPYGIFNRFNRYSYRSCSTIYG